MSIKINYIITDENITVNYSGQTHIVPRTDALADRLIDALRKKDLNVIPELVSAANRIKKFSKGAFVVDNGEIFINGVVVPAVLGNKIVKFSNEGLPHQPLVKFAENLQANPSFRAVNELFSFLEKNDHPITEKGNFIAYKRVGADFLDLYSHTFDNSPGSVVEIPRNQVDEDSSQTCSRGLHVANWNYAHTQYGNTSADTTDIMLEVEVNPADVVAIPSDYNQSKMRVCRYTVIGVIDKEHSSEVAYRVVDSAINDSFDDKEDCDCDCEDCDCDCGACVESSYDDEEEGEECHCDTCEPAIETDDYPWDEELV